MLLFFPLSDLTRANLHCDWGYWLSWLGKILEKTGGQREKNLRKLAVASKILEGLPV
jgi:hypothetical protein